MAELKEVFEMTTRQMEPDQDSWNQQERRQRRTARNRKLGAFAVAAAIGLAAVAMFLATRPAGNRTTPAGETPTVNPADAAAVKVAMGFLNAYGLFDAKTAMTYVAADAMLSGLIDGQVPPNTQGLSLMLSWYKASGYQQTITSCEATTLAADTTVACTYDFHGIRSDEIGRGPFSGSEFTFTVRDGKIVQASDYLDTEKFSPQMWEPFADWVSNTYPKDVAVMYQGGINTNYRLAKDSIRLWEQRTKEYVKEVQATQGQ